MVAEDGLMTNEKSSADLVVMEKVGNFILYVALEPSVVHCGYCRWILAE